MLVTISPFMMSEMRPRWRNIIARGSEQNRSQSGGPESQPWMPPICGGGDNIAGVTSGAIRWEAWTLTGHWWWPLTLADNRMGTWGASGALHSPSSYIHFLLSAAERWEMSSEAKIFIGTNSQGFSESWSCLFLWPWANYFIYLKIGFLTCKWRKFLSKLLWRLTDRDLALSLAHRASGTIVVFIIQVTPSYLLLTLPSLHVGADLSSWSWPASQRKGSSSQRSLQPWSPDPQLSSTAFPSPAPLPLGPGSQLQGDPLESGWGRRSQGAGGMDGLCEQWEMREKVWSKPKDGEALGHSLEMNGYVE